MERLPRRRPPTPQDAGHPCGRRRPARGERLVGPAGRLSLPPFANPASAPNTTRRL